MNNHHNFDFPLLTAALGFFASFLKSATEVRQYMPTTGEVFHDLILASICAMASFTVGLVLNFFKKKLK